MLLLQLKNITQNRQYIVNEIKKKSKKKTSYATGAIIVIKYFDCLSSFEELR